MLRRRIVDASVWLGVSRLAAQAISFARVVVLSRLLAPGDFGAFAIALTLLAAVEVLTQSGLNSAIVQSGQRVERYADAVWTFNFLRGLVLCVLLLLLGPPAAAYFAMPETAPLIQALGACVLLRGGASMGQVYQQKDVQFRVQSIQNTLGIAIDAVVTIALAAAVGGPWALAAGLLAGEAVKTAASYALHPYRPRFTFDREALGELTPYGRWVYASSLIMLANSAGPALVIGKLLGAVPLGFFQMASRLAGMASKDLSALLGQIAFPVYSGLREDPAQVARVYGRSVAILVAAAMPFCLLLVVLGGPVIEVLLGSQWQAVSAPLAVLAVEGLIRALASTSVPVFRGLGVPAHEAACHALRAVVFVVAVLPLTHAFGVAGAASAVLLSSAGWLAMSFVLLRRTVGISVRQVLGTVGPVVAANVAFAVVLVVLREYADAGLAGLVLVAAAGGAAYLLIGWRLGLRSLLA